MAFALKKCDSYFCVKNKSQTHQNLRFMIKMHSCKEKTFYKSIIQLIRNFYQLKSPLNIEYMISADDSVCLLSQFIDEMR